MYKRSFRGAPVCSPSQPPLISLPHQRRAPRQCLLVVEPADRGVECCENGPVRASSSKPFPARSYAVVTPCSRAVSCTRTLAVALQASTWQHARWRIVRDSVTPCSGLLQYYVPPIVVAPCVATQPRSLIADVGSFTFGQPHFRKRSVIPTIPHSPLSILAPSILHLRTDTHRYRNHGQDQPQ
jgi:hypothetical protein